MGRRLRWSLITAGLLTAAWFLSWLGAKALILRKEISNPDAIVVLAGSSTYRERARFAAQLFNERRGTTVVLTNDGLMGGYSATEDRNPFFVERMAAELRRLGVPSSQIRIIPVLVANTGEEALVVKDYAEKNSLRSILLVTTPYQSRRALFTFARVFQGSQIEIGIDAPPPGEQSPRPAFWWTRILGWKLVPGEYLKIMYYKLKYR